MIYRLTYEYNGKPVSARFEAHDLDMAVAQMKLEDPVVCSHGKLISAAVDAEGYGDNFQKISI